MRNTPLPRAARTLSTADRSARPLPRTSKNQTELRSAESTGSLAGTAKKEWGHAAPPLPPNPSPPIYCRSRRGHALTSLLDRCVPRTPTVMLGSKVYAETHRPSAPALQKGSGGTRDPRRNKQQLRPTDDCRQTCRLAESTRRLQARLPAGRDECRVTGNLFAGKLRCRQASASYQCLRNGGTTADAALYAGPPCVTWRRGCEDRARRTARARPVRTRRW